MKTIRRAKTNWYEGEIEACGRDSGRMWKLLKKLVKRNIGNNQNDNGICFGNLEYTNDIQIAEEFNKYYVNSISEIVSGMCANGRNDNEGLDERDMAIGFDKFKEITMLDLMKIVQN